MRVIEKRPISMRINLLQPAAVSRRLPSRTQIDQVCRKLALLREKVDQLELALSMPLEAITPAFSKLQKQAAYDQLTGLQNRWLFKVRAEEEYSRFKRHGCHFSCLVIDLDHFKKVNDTYGHKAGDLALSSVAGTIKRNLRAMDQACRRGGEEIVIILPETTIPEALAVAEKLRSAVESLKLEESGQCFGVTMSIGISGTQQTANSLEQIEKMADKNMYAAKDAGRNKVVSNSSEADIPPDPKRE